MTEFKPIKEGKVREIYDNGDSLIMVATDRISAFDVILKNKVTNKGKVLTQMSRFWFDYTKDVLPNHMLSVDTADMPEFFRTPAFEGRSMKCRKLLRIAVGRKLIIPETSFLPLPAAAPFCRIPGALFWPHGSTLFSSGEISFRHGAIWFPI